MNRPKSVLASARLVNSLISAAIDTALPLSYKVRHVSLFTPPVCCPTREFSFFSVHQNLYFSTKPNLLVELVLANEWSDELGHELQEAYPSLTHETVIYVLKKLDKYPEKTSDFFNWVREKSGFSPSSSVYSLILRILVNKDSMRQFWITLRKMKEQELCVDEETYRTILGVLKKENMNSDSVALTQFYSRMLQENDVGSVMANVFDIILSKEWSFDVEKELRQLKIPVSDNFIIRVLKELRNYPLKALKFFHWVGTCPDYEHNTVTYNAISRVLARDDSIGEFWEVFEEMKNMGVEMDIDTYVKVSRQFQKNKMVEDAVKLYEIMMDGPYRPSLQDCSVLLRSISASDAPNLELVFRVAKKYESTGNTLSKVIYDGIHRSLTSLGKIDEAEKLVKVMRNAGYEPDNITYSQAVFGLCKAGRLEEACKILDEMEGHGCVPDIKTWTILIQGHCAAKEIDGALLCFAKMIEKGCEPDANLLDVLADGFLRLKKIEGAYRLLLEMVSKLRVSPWQATYKRLIEELLGASRFEEAIELLRLMKTHNYPPHPEPFVRYISKFGTVDDAIEFFKALSVKQYPSSSAYIHVFESLFQEGRHSEAKDLLFKCPHHIRKHDKIFKLFGSTNGSAADASPHTKTSSPVLN